MMRSAGDVPNSFGHFSAFTGDRLYISGARISTGALALTAVIVTSKVGNPS